MPLLIHVAAYMDDTKTETYIDMDMALAPRCASTHAKAGIVGLQLLVFNVHLIHVFLPASRHWIKSRRRCLLDLHCILCRLLRGIHLHSLHGCRTLHGLACHGLYDVRGAMDDLKLQLELSQVNIIT